MERQLAEAKCNNPFKLEFKRRYRLNSGANYNIWSIRMRGFLKEAGLWSYVDGSIERLTDLKKRFDTIVSIDDSPA